MLNLNYEPNIIKSTANLTREEWLKDRRLGIGGSEASIVMGVSPWATRRDLYYDKIGRKPIRIDPEEDNWIAKQVGNRLEELVAMIFSRKTGFEVYEDKNMYSHPLYPFMIADLDFVISFPDGTKGILECKTCNYNSQFKWKDNQVPINYEWQCRHYMAVKNYKVAYIACLYGNNDSEFFIRRIDRDLDLEEQLIEKEKYFWMEQVQARREPPYEEQPDLVLESIRRYAGTPDQTLPPINLEEEDKNQIDRYLQLAERKSQLDAMRRKIEQEQKTLSIPFVEKLGKNCSAVLLSGNDRYRITYNPTSRKIVNKENITKLENLYPDAYADVVSESVSRTFRVKKEAV